MKVRAYQHLLPILCWKIALLEESQRIVAALILMAEDVMLNYMPTRDKWYEKVVEPIWEKGKRIQFPACANCGLRFCGGLAFSVGDCATRIARGDIKGRGRKI